MFRSISEYEVMYSVFSKKHTVQLCIADYMYVVVLIKREQNSIADVLASFRSLTVAYAGLAAFRSSRQSGSMPK